MILVWPHHHDSRPLSRGLEGCKIEKIFNILTGMTLADGLGSEEEGAAILHLVPAVAVRGCESVALGLRHFLRRFGLQLLQ